MTKCLSYKLVSPTLPDFGTCEEGAEIVEGNTTLESLFDDSCDETQRFEQAVEEQHGIL